MIKRIGILLILAVAFLAPASVLAQDDPEATEAAQVEETAPQYNFSQMNTYELFWPLVAGKVPGDRFYKFKAWRDQLMGKLIFSSFKKAEYFKLQANKRLIEAEKLLEIDRQSFLPTTVDQSAALLEQGAALAFAGEASDQKLWLQEEFAKDIRRHQVILERMKEKISEAPKEAVEKALQKINELIERYQLDLARFN